MTITVNLELGKREIENFQELEETIYRTVLQFGREIAAKALESLDEQSRVFERFYRVDKSHSKRIGGTGLGLSIVKHGAQFHNAQISLESEPGKGTTVTLTFPASGKQI